MKFQKTITNIIVFATIFLIPFYFFRFSLGPIKTNIFEISVLLLLLSTFPPRLAEGETGYFLLSTKKQFQFGSVYPYIFIAFSFLSIFLSTDHTRALGIFKGWFLVPFVLYLLIINLINKQNVQKIIWPLYSSALIISIWAILQKFGLITALFYQKGDSSFAQYLDQGRSFGPFESPNFLAMFLVPIVFLSLLLLPYIKNKTRKIVFGFSLILPLLAIYYSGSKAGLIALFAGNLIILLINLYFLVKTKSQKILVTIIFIVVSFLSGFIASTKIDSNTASNDIRKQIYSYSVQIIKDKPVLGIGLGDFQDTIAKYSANDHSFQEWGVPYALHPHNLFLAMWLNLGLIGLVFFLAVLVKFLLNSFKSQDNFTTSLILAAMTAIIVHGLFDTTYFKNDLSAIFWLIIALSVIYSNKHENILEI